MNQISRLPTILVLALTSFSVSIFAGKPAPAPETLCGKLTSYCGNGWCNKAVTPTYCLGAIKPGPTPEVPDQGVNCSDGQPVNVQSENATALTQLDELLNSGGEGTRVCVVGNRDPSGLFHVQSASPEDASTSYHVGISKHHK